MHEEIKHLKTKKSKLESALSSTQTEVRLSLFIEYCYVFYSSIAALLSEPINSVLIILCLSVENVNFAPKPP